jgi:hypothetical protein
LCFLDSPKGEQSGKSPYNGSIHNTTIDKFSYVVILFQLCDAFGAAPIMSLRKCTNFKSGGGDKAIEQWGFFKLQNKWHCADRLFCWLLRLWNSSLYSFATSGSSSITKSKLYVLVLVPEHRNCMFARASTHLSRSYKVFQFQCSKSGVRALCSVADRSVDRADDRRSPFVQLGGRPLVH